MAAGSFSYRLRKGNYPLLLSVLFSCGRAFPAMHPPYYPYARFGCPCTMVLPIRQTRDSPTSLLRYRAILVDQIRYLNEHRVSQATLRRCPLPDRASSDLHEQRRENLVALRLTIDLAASTVSSPSDRGLS